MLAHRIHHLAEKSHVIEFFALLKLIGEFPAAFKDLAAEAFDFVGGPATEVVVQRFAGFKLLAVDEQRVGPGERVAMLIKVAEQREAAGYRSL